MEIRLDLVLVVLMAVLVSGHSEIDRQISQVAAGSSKSVYERVLDILRHTDGNQQLGTGAGEIRVQDLLHLNDFNRNKCQRDQLKRSERFCQHFDGDQGDLMRNLHLYCVEAHERVKSKCSQVARPRELEGPSSVDKEIESIGDWHWRIDSSGARSYEPVDTRRAVVSALLRFKGNRNQPKVVAGRWSVNQIYNLNWISGKKCSRQELERRRNFCKQFKLKQTVLMRNLFKYCAAASERNELKCSAIIESKRA